MDIHKLSTNYLKKTGFQLRSAVSWVLRTAPHSLWRCRGWSSNLPRWPAPRKANWWRCQGIINVIPSYTKLYQVIPSDFISCIYIYAYISPEIYVQIWYFPRAWLKTFALALLYNICHSFFPFFPKTPKNRPMERIPDAPCWNIHPQNWAHFFWGKKIGNLPPWSIWAWCSILPFFISCVFLYKYLSRHFPEIFPKRLGKTLFHGSIRPGQLFGDM